jgi:hypothetical protein
MSFLIKMLTRMGLLKDGLDYHVMRASMGAHFRVVWLPEVVPI